MTTLVVVRHAEAEGNPERRFIGQCDVALSELGRRQADSLARRLAGLPISRIVSSDLCRALDTVTPLSEALGIPIDTDPRLREIANGEWGMLLPDEIAAGWPELWARYQDGEDVLRPGGESWNEVRARVLAAVEEIVREGADETVVVSTHAGPILSLLGWAAGAPARGSVFFGPFGRLDNASISMVALPGPRLLTVNDTGHLSSGPV
ncbi:MAG: histidine phosphatase family protein [Actinomycetota bacterium]|nr:histidine phosphatase family protein [Actinomycetota bacterium]